MVSTRLRSVRLLDRDDWPECSELIELPVPVRCRAPFLLKVKELARLVPGEGEPDREPSS